MRSDGTSAIASAHNRETEAHSRGIGNNRVPASDWPANCFVCSDGLGKDETRLFSPR